MNVAYLKKNILKKINDFEKNKSKNRIKVRKNSFFIHFLYKVSKSLLHMKSLQDKLKHCMFLNDKVSKHLLRLKNMYEKE